MTLRLRRLLVGLAALTALACACASPERRAPGAADPTTPEAEVEALCRLEVPCPGEPQPDEDLEACVAKATAAAGDPCLAPMIAVRRCAAAHARCTPEGLLDPAASRAGLVESCGAEIGRFDACCAERGGALCPGPSDL